MSSILVRITGNALIVGCMLIIWWFVAAATGPDAYARANGVITSWFGDLVMFLSVWALWYHMAGGIRHLIWDSGHMLDVKRSEVYAQVSILVATLLTIFTAIVL